MPSTLAHHHSISSVSEGAFCKTVTTVSTILSIILILSVPQLHFPNIKSGLQFQIL